MIMSDSADVKPGGNMSMRDLKSDVQPGVNESVWDLRDEDVKPDMNVMMWDSKEVEPVVEKEEPDSLEDEKPCIEALRASVLLSAESCRQRGSVPAVNRQENNAIRSIEAGCNADEDYNASLISETGEKPASPIPLLDLECSDIKEEETENCESNGYPRDSQVSEQQWEDKSASNAKDLSSQFLQAQPEHCEADNVSTVGQPETQQSHVTAGQFEFSWSPNVYFLLTGRQIHMKQALNDEYLKSLPVHGWHYTTSSPQQSGPSGNCLEKSRPITSKLVRLASKADSRPPDRPLNVRSNKESSVTVCPMISIKKSSSSKRRPMINKRLSLDKDSPGTRSFEEEKCKSYMSTHGHVQVSRFGNYKKDKTFVYPKVRDMKSDHSGDQVDKHKRSQTREEPFKCNLCGKEFSRGRQFLQHKKNQPYRCEGFVQSGDLLSHKRTCTVEKSYLCDVCGKVFELSSALLVHMKTHMDEKPFMCDVCGKGYTKSSDFLGHKRSHTGERPYKCDVCGKAFVRSGDLLVHERIHTGEKPYKCDVCGKAFVGSGALTKHKRTHTGEKPYKCGVCGKGFRQSIALRVHERTHTGEKPYKCDVCGEGFGQSGSLLSHKRTHTGEKPYMCDVCGKGFGRSNALFSHKRTHRNKNP